MKREEVEKLLVYADAGPNGPLARLSSDDLRALCERWLAVQNAPVAEIDSSGELVTLIAEGSGLDNALLSAHIDTLHGQRVRIVPDPVAGNGGGDE